LRILFVTRLHRFASGSNTIAGYVRGSQELGHEVAVFGEPDLQFPHIPHSLAVDTFDAAVFVINEAADLPDLPDVARLLDGLPRDRRVVIDTCGRYNDTIRAGGDTNHFERLDGRTGQDWVTSLEALGGLILQPALVPLRADVRPFLFHGYEPGEERNLDFSTKPYGVAYVGDNWFRWGALEAILEALEPSRTSIGKVMVAGDGWTESPSWLSERAGAEACFTDPAYLGRLGVETRPPVPARDVLATMSQGVLNPVLVRPLFKHLGIVTPRLFETAAASTLPFLDLEPGDAVRLCGPAAAALTATENLAETVLDMLREPSRYVDILLEVRRHLSEAHSFIGRVEELVSICAESR
jgi:hypothetical protein